MLLWPRARRPHHEDPAAVGAVGADGSRRDFVLENGDRVSGQVLSEGERSFRIQTQYGGLVIPRAHIVRILGDDGAQLFPTPTPTPVPTPTPAPVCDLLLEVTGSVFWYAWPTRGSDVDPTLRLQVSLDGIPSATFVDATPNPDVVAAPLVNSFSFSEGTLFLESGAETRVAAPDVAPGHVQLWVGLPPTMGGTHWLEVTYQINKGTATQPAFHDLVTAGAQVVLRVGGLTRVVVAQDRGKMEYSGLFKKRMKNVDTFQLELRPE